MEPEEPEVPDGRGNEGQGEAPGTRRGALLGLAIILLLVIGGLVLTHVLRGMAQVQDCALSGRSNCS
jgi:hypothetical protein